MGNEMMSTTRSGAVSRTTKETDIQINLTLEGSGVGDIATGIPFFDHMLTSLTRYGFFDLGLHARGDPALEKRLIGPWGPKKAFSALVMSSCPWTKRWCR
jgi:hypothetical protein